MAKPVTLEKFRKSIFEDFDDMMLTDGERFQLRRIRTIYTVQLDNPSISNAEIVKLLMNEYGISLSQSYRDIADTHLLLGSVPNASKQWVRYMVVESLKSVIDGATKLIESFTSDDGELLAGNDEKDIIIKAMNAKTKAAKELAKYTRLDQVDPEMLPFDEIVPVNVDYFNDPSILTGVEVDNPIEAVDKVLKKYIDFEESVD